MFLSTMPLWLSDIILVGMTTLVAMSGPALIRRRIHLDRLRVNHEVAGFEFATVGVLYAVLLAFAVIVVWEKFAEAERTVAKEAGAVRSTASQADAAKAFRRNLTDCSAVINEDWPAMERGGACPRGLDRAYATILAAHPADQRGGALLSEVLRQLDVVPQRGAIGLSRPRGRFPAWFGSYCSPARFSRSASRSFSARRTSLCRR